jgi:LuxR family transcriptional activator of conjugal transfer of Ti plasmids
MLSQKFRDSLKSLEDAKDLDDVSNAIESYVGTIGFSGFHLAFMDTVNFRRDEAPIKVITSMNDNWMEYYSKERYDLLDSGVKSIRDGGYLPVLTGLEIEQEERDLSKEERRFLGDAMDANWRTGAIVPINQGNGIPTGIGLSSEYSSEEFHKMWSEKQAETLLFMSYLNNQLSTPIQMLSLDGKQLTERELDCLAYLSEDYRPKEIAHKLSIKPETVNFHLKNVRKKMNSKTNGNAIAKAVRLEII